MSKIENRTAVIREKEIYVVDLYEDGVLIEDRHLPGKSIHYAEDVKKNWENGIIQIDNPVISGESGISWLR